MNVLSRFRTLDAEKVWSRLARESRKVAGMVRARIAPPQWRRADLAKALAAAERGDSAALEEARRALSSRDFSAAHVHLAKHFSSVERRFALHTPALPSLVDRIRSRFPGATADSTRRAEQLLSGRYDVLGYEAVPFGTPPRWHTDPVHGRKMPREYWSSIRYLNPRFGDYKIIWEINRHQHWLALGRAYHLTADPRYYGAVIEELENWMTTNPPFHGVNWANMLEVGFRTISWTWALYFFAATGSGRGETPWLVDLLLGLDCQLQHIEDNLSRQVSPNTQLLGAALALYVVSAAVPELRASARRVALGRRMLTDELARQVNADGGHAELSAHYHRYATDFYLLAALTAQVTRDPAAAVFERAAHKLAAYLRSMADDEGRLPLIGDDDGGQLFPICGRPPSDCRDTLAAAAAILDAPALLVSEVPEEAFWLCGTQRLDSLEWRRAPWPSTALPDSGYYISRTSNGDHLVFDAGRHGFLNGAHAHADALSIVLTVGGQPLLVDSGTATYTMDSSLRNHFRTTAMHNTVVVGRHPQSQPRGPFHWITPTDARAPFWLSTPAFDYVEGHHEGYSPIVHSRSVLALYGFGWIIVDHLLGNAETTADAFWHLHPSWIAATDRMGVTAQHPSGSRVAIASSLPLEILPPDIANGLDAYAPLYGRIERGICLRARSGGPLPRSFATFVTRARASATAPADNVTVASVPLTSPPPEGWHGAAFSIAAAGREAVILASVECRPSATASKPGSVWGTQLARTDARVALAYLDGASPPVLIHGTRLERPAGLLRA